MTSPSEQALLVEKRDGVAIVTLNRPQVVNAINDAIRMGLPRALAEADADPEVRVIVLHGGQGRGFCAGADIKEKRENETLITARSRLTRDAWVKAFDRTAKPVIAAIHGFCMGGGMEMALACDIRIASKNAQFALPETGLGLIPGAGGTQRLPRLIGLSRALDMMLTGERIDGEEAHRVGLVSRVVDSTEEVLPAALALAEKIASKAPLATLYVKEAAVKGSSLPLEEGLTLEANLFTLLLSTEDRVEAAKAFAEKRKPTFKGA